MFRYIRSKMENTCYAHLADDFNDKFVSYRRIKYLYNTDIELPENIDTTKAVKELFNVLPLVKFTKSTFK